MALDDVIQRFFEKKPFNDEQGLRGPNVPLEPLREVLGPGGTTGGVGSYQVEQRLPTPPPVEMGALGGTGGSGTIRARYIDTSGGSPTTATGSFLTP